ncbi:phosphate ABC transporter permease PstA [Salinicoccus sp. ID82-1]|uniref:Phosphate transport system permease protein PstA n=1 Tax=Salinicoccus cyprini TaxID=2493691 RepID=A0A558AYX4_9STAP|nr:MULTISPECIES: phosphate ABC transporter permease PstA [Salinicoccus]MCG1009005.1 phosphate ABC transporter permease PstA [Salinicoccus sp. ID82-1]TVT29457.1 phosphate ABC transporter permease PstA [Salinicoccus cyprini]
MELINKQEVSKKLSGRLLLNKVLKYIFLLFTLVGLVVLATLLIDTVLDGWRYLTPDFFTSYSSSRPESAGIYGALIGTLWLMAVTAPIAIILSVGTALYLEEYAPKNRLVNFIKVNISNLAGVPSVVFGLLGLTLFVRLMELDSSVLAAALTMSLMILPVIVVASQESIRSVPSTIREASIGMGATKWQTITRVILPAAVPGIITGIILALSRAIGETAPLIIIGIPTILLFTPTGVLDTFSALPMQIYSWVKLPNPEFQSVTAAGIIVLLFILFLMNSVAIYIRNKYSKRF